MITELIGRTFTMEDGKGFTVKKANMAPLKAARINGKLELIKRVELTTTEGEIIEAPLSLFDTFHVEQPQGSEGDE